MSIDKSLLTGSTTVLARIYAIPKETFLDFLLSKEYNNIEQKSKLHEKTNLQLIK